MPTISVFIDEEEEDILNKRAKKNLMTLNEQVQDIIRRSCVNAKKNYVPQDSCDDRLVQIFSKQNKGRKPTTKSKEGLQDKKVKSLLKKGNEQLKVGKKADARKTYTKIRKEFAKLKTKDKRLYKDIMGFYTQLLK